MFASTGENILNKITPARIELSDRESAQNILRDLMISEKKNELNKFDVSSYDFFRLLQEEVVESYGSGQASLKFLTKYREETGMTNEEIEEMCGIYFKNVNKVFFYFENKIRRIYNMSDEELSEELESRGYRYRPTD